MNNSVKSFFLILLLLSFSGTLSASDSFGKVDLLKNRRKKHPLGINVGVLGITGWGNVSADWFITPKLNVEGGLGIQTTGLSPISYFGGVKYHILGKSPSNLTPYFGIYDAVFTNEGKLHQHNLYFPIGIHKIKRNKFSWSLEVAYQFNSYSDRNLWGGFKIGYRFL